MPESPSRWSTEPTGREVLLIFLTTWLVFVTTIRLLEPNLFVLVENFCDNHLYIEVASAIRHWDFTGLIVFHFWGLPYFMAGLSKLTGCSDRTALLLISGSASLVSVAVAYQLWGGWVAGFFAVLNFVWMQLSFLGGAEPLFVALLFGAFLAARRDRWMLAALLASCSTIVRPLGFLALIGIEVTLLWQRDFRKFILATFIALVIGGLYILPLWRYFGDPLATVHSYYRGSVGPGGGSSFAPWVSKWMAIWASILCHYQGNDAFSRGLDQSYREFRVDLLRSRRNSRNDSHDSFPPVRQGAPDRDYFRSTLPYRHLLV